ncbi:MAG TPA: ABC transporter family substrate-binding protein [Kineosporiaceae bacterium]|nr:ABC transporter family substrate-binding protein [Kineosporiaceae bacterium]
MSTKRTGSKVLALLTGSTLALTACATSSGGSSSSSSASSAPVTIKLGYAQEFSAYNSNTSDGGGILANPLVLNQVLRGFVYFRPDGSVGHDTDFGSLEKTSDNPLTVKYRINPKATWSDGKPVECDDVTLTWLANSSLTGDKGFNAASTVGYEQMNPPACKAGDKDFTVTYKSPFADWEGGVFNWTSILPAHIVEAQAGMTKTFVDYAATPTSPDLAKAIDFYNKGWAFNAGQLKKDIIPSSGPYVIDSWAGGQSLTLKANPKWWGAQPKAQTLIVRIIADDAQAQALQNGEINVMEPQPQVDILNQLKQQGSKVSVQSGDQYSFEHLDFNFKSMFADKNLREAFALCVPRQEIVNNLVVPSNPKAKILESRFTFPFQKEYSASVAGIGSEAYDTVNIAKAKQLVTAAGKTGAEVRIGWKKLPTAPNKRRADTIALIQASCAQAGFKVVDAGTSTFWDKELPDGNFDVAMFGWVGSPLVSGNPPIYQTRAGGKGMQNNGYYSNPQVDALLTELNQELNADKRMALLKKIDTQLWTDLATIPLFAFPNLVATDSKIQNVKMNTTQQDVTWNAQEWTLKQ